MDLVEQLEFKCLDAGRALYTARYQRDDDDDVTPGGIEIRIYVYFREIVTITTTRQTPRSVTATVGRLTVYRMSIIT